MADFFQHKTSQVIAKGLCNLVDVDGGPTPEQRGLLGVLFVHLFGLCPSALDFESSLSAPDLAAELSESSDRRRFLQLATMLELCRHPRSENQLRRLEAFAKALQIQGPELRLLQDLCHQSAEEATADFKRTYSNYFPELSEGYHRIESGSQEIAYDDEFFEKLAQFSALPQGSLGKCFAEFYARNRLTMPTRQTVNPGYYVWHDMSHVITGYETTSIGEVSLGAFKLAMNDSDANWMASLTNLMIHEVGLFRPGGSSQYVVYGGDGDPYGSEPSAGVMSQPGAQEYFAEALQRGTACTADFTALDHLAIADVPLIDIRRHYNVPPLRQSMFDDAHLWPS
jgi:hypothetical protein